MPDILSLRIHALYLESPQQVIGQDIRFENIPWMNTEAGVFENPNVPLETNSIIPRPFSWDNGIYLEEGVHLHFVLPASFKKFDDQGNLPKAPNRWYIKRERDGKEWIVESDYIWNINDPELNKSTTCTYTEEGHAPFSFIYTGRTYRMEDWLHKSDTNGRYLKNLTALGWGSFSFDIHYPNCRSIFGFYDEDGRADDAYTVMGWLEDSGKSAGDQYIVAGKFQLRPETAAENDESFDIAIANTLPETLSALIINRNNPDLSKLDLQKQEEQMASMIHFDELKDLNLDWISRLRHKQHEQQFNKTSGTTKYILNIVQADDEDFMKEYDFDINLLDFDFSKEVDRQYRNIQETLNSLPQSELSEETILATWQGVGFPELVPVSFNDSLEEELEAINRIMNNGELDTFRLHAKIESLYLHWSTYLSALFLTKDQNINKVKDDLRLLISQITILKKKLRKKEQRIADLQLLFERKISGYYTKYCDYAIIRFLIKAKNAGEVIDREEFKALLDQRYKTKIALSKKSRTDYFSALPPSVIISSAKSNTVFNLFTNPSAVHDPKPELVFNSKEKDTYKNIVNEIADVQEINVNGWHTYKVEWESSFLPKKEGHYLAADKRFSENFLRDSYILDELNADLIKEYQLNDLSYMPNPNTYYGHSFVSNTVREYVKEKLEKNLSRIDEAENVHLMAQMKTFLNTLEDTSLFELTLSDFNNLMLQRSNGLSVLPLIPNGFEDHREIARDIENLCKEYFNSLNLLTPNRSAIFNPFRNGAFKISRLRIIDSFGRDRIIRPRKILTTHVQKIENKDQWVMLPPRYLQAAALSTRFTRTLTDKKKSSVLGWMVPVYLNQRIEFFDAHGKHLGAIDTEGQWESSPFDADLAEANSGYRSVVKNPHLKRIIHWIIERICKPDKKDQMIRELQKAMEHTSPEDAANPSLLETISSVPIAITLVNINLFTKGEALYDINYSEKISINTYDSQRKYDKVKIPLSVGDLNQYNDGVLAYWHYNLKDEDREGENRLGLKYLDSKIYFNNDVTKKIEHQSYSLKDFLKENPIDGRQKWNALESKALTSSSIHYKSQDKESHLALNDTLNACQRYVLMHPKGNLNVKTGILPEKSIKLPYHRIKNALKRIELTLLTAPVLTPKENLQLSLAKDNRYEWSWIQLEKKIKKEPLSSGNPPLKKRITQNLAIDFSKNTETENDLRTLLSDLKNEGLLIDEISEFFPGEKIYFIRKDAFDSEQETARNTIREGFINDVVTGRIFKEERIRSQKVAFDFNNFKTKKYLALKAFIIKEEFAVPSETDLLGEDVFFINFSRINALASKGGSALNDSEKELMNLLALKNSNKIIDLKQLFSKLYAFGADDASMMISEGFKQSLMNKKIIRQDAFYPDEQIYFVNAGELEKVRLKEQPDEYEKTLLRLMDENSPGILQINDFNTNSGDVPKLVLKEGWLSIKSTKF